MLACLVMMVDVRFLFITQIQLFLEFQRIKRFHTLHRGV